MTGLGFALVSGPLLVLVLDPFNGIALANILSAAISALVLLRTFRDTDWRAVGKLLIGLAVGMPLGVLVVYSLPSEMLLIVVGSITGIAVLFALFKRSLRIFKGTPGSIAAGAVSGFSNVTAGVGGPALALYGAATAMSVQAFIPTVQAVGLVTNAISIAAKPTLHIPLPLLLGSFGCVAFGLILGSLLRRFVPASRAQKLALMLALIGSLAATVRGILLLLG